MQTFSRSVTVTSDPPGATIWKKEGREYTCTNTVTPAKIDLIFHGESDTKQLLLKKFGYLNQKIALDAEHNDAFAALGKSGAPLFADLGDAPPEVRSLNARLRKEFEEAFLAGSDPFSCAPLEFLSFELIKSAEDRRFDLGVSLVLDPSDAARKLRVADHSRTNPQERVSKMGQAALEGGVADVVARISTVAARFPEIKDLLVACSYSTTEAALDNEKLPFIAQRQEVHPDNTKVGGARVDIIHDHHVTTNAVVVDKAAVGTLTIAMPLGKVPAAKDREAITKAVLSDGAVSNLAGVAGREGIADLVRQHRGRDYSKEVDEAIIAGDQEKVKALLRDNPLLVFSKDNAEYKPEFIGNTPLHIAVLGQQKNMAQLLLANGADANAGDNKYGFTPLHDVACGGPADLAQLLLANKADVNALDNTGATPLNVAAFCGNVDVAKVLLARGADINAKDNGGWTPLHAAIVKGHMPMQVLLMEARDIGGQAEVMLAFKEGDLTKKKQMLNDLPELIYARDRDGWTLLHWAVARDKDAAELLLAKGADVNARSNYGETPLHEAAIQGHKDMGALLIAKGADVNAKNKADETPLHFAASYGYMDVAELLLASKAEVNAKEKNGSTPLHLAKVAGREDIASLLRQYGGHE